MNYLTHVSQPNFSIKETSGEQEHKASHSHIFVQATPGSFNQQAIELLFQDSIKNKQIHFCGTPLDAFRFAHEKKGVAFVAIINTIIPGNFVEATLKALKEYRIIRVISSIRMKIEMAYIRHEDAILNNVRLTHIASHPAALQQISKWKSNRHSVTEIPIEKGTGEAARQLSAGELPMNAAVIGPKNLVKLYPNLKVVEESIQDRKDNFTTFVLIEIDKRSQPVDQETIIEELNEPVAKL